MSTPTLVMMVGPTAVGKTEASIRLAQHYDTEIVSVDARQFYRETHIGTAKPSAEALSRVRHHLVDFLPISQPYHVKQFEQDALQAIATVHRHRPLALAVGGSGLYVNTLVYGIDDMPEIPPPIRAHLIDRWQQSGLSGLVDELKQVDPAYYATVDRQNHRRVIRALEVYHTTGLPYSSFRQRRPETLRPFDTILVGLNRPRTVLYQRINQRVDQMIAQGLVEEAHRLYPWRNHQALRTVGYQEIFPVFDGQYDEEEAIRLIKRNTRRYAKRQMTWFRKNDAIRWFDAEQETDAVVKDIIAYIDGERLRKSRSSGS